MKTNEATLSAPGQSLRSVDHLHTLSSKLNREVTFIHESTGFSLTLLDAIRILAFSLLVCAALFMNFEGSTPWQILCAVEAVQLVIPALKSIFVQC